jgi:hypothetical protein
MKQMPLVNSWFLREGIEGLRKEKAGTPGMISNVTWLECRSPNYRKKEKGASQGPVSEAKVERELDFAVA